MPSKKPLSNIAAIADSNGSIVTLTIPTEEVEIIRRYQFDIQVSDLRKFVANTISSTTKWMNRMIIGQGVFELDTMEHWIFNSTNYRLSMKVKRDFETVFDMSFTQGDIHQYNEGLSTILSGYWYKSHALPTAVVELIAAADILYRNHHNGTSPASASGLSHADIDVR